MKKAVVVFLILSGIFAIGVIAQDLTVKKSTLVTIPAKVTINAPRAKVWKTVTSVEGFCALTGFVPAASDKTKSFTATGSSFPAQIWGDKGKLIATLVQPEQELRVTWEPDNGGYLCAKRIVLKDSGSATTVEYWDRYTDDQTAANVDATAKKVVEETKTGIASFKALAEK